MHPLFRWIVLPGLTIWILYSGVKYLVADKQAIGVFLTEENFLEYHRYENMCRREKVDATRWLQFLAEQGIEPAKDVKVVSAAAHTAAGNKISRRGMLARQSILLASEGHTKEEIAQQLQIPQSDVAYVFRLVDAMHSEKNQTNP